MKDLPSAVLLRTHSSKATTQRATTFTLLALAAFALALVFIAGMEFHPTELRQVIRPNLEKIAQPQTGGGERPDQKTGGRFFGDRWH